MNTPPVERSKPPAPNRDDATQDLRGRVKPPGQVSEAGAGPDASDRDNQDLDLGFLLPANRSDSLGRLSHYEILAVLGRGGFGVVFRAFDDVLQRVVAIKVLSAERASSTARKRFLREARSAAQVRHENVVQTYAVEEQPLPYLVMEFIPGETLQQRLDRSGPFDPDEVAAIGRQIADGLAAAHAVGLVHRDVKPANLLLEDGPRLLVKVTDFGLARATDDVDITQSGTIVGTPTYMSPEQASGRVLDHRSDLFSLGSVLYAMTTGQLPFRAETPLALLLSVATDTPQPIREIAPNTPAWLCDLIERLMAKDPAARIPDARTVAKLLSAHAREGEKTENARKPAVDTRSVGRQVGLWLALAAVLFVGAVLSYSLLMGRPQVEVAPPPPPPPPPPSQAKTQTVAEILTSADFEWGPPENLGPGINTADREMMAALTDDERTIVFCRDRNLYSSRRGSVSEPFPAAEPLPDAPDAPIAQSPTLTGDGLILVYSYIRPATKSQETWMRSRASINEPFGNPIRLPRTEAPFGWESGPVLSSDGLTLLVTSPRGPGKGDVYTLTRKSRNENFGDETPVPGEVNTPGFDVASWLSADGLVLLGTKLDKPPHETRFFVRRTASEPFGPAQSFGPPLVGFEVGRPWLSPDGTRLYFHSRIGEGKPGNLDVWVSRRRPRKGP